MTRTLTIWASLIVLSGFSVASCATPSYPIQASSSAAAPSATTPAPAPAPSTPSSMPDSPPPNAAAATPPVDSQPLPPVPSNQPPQSPAQSAVPPDYTPPAAAAPAETQEPTATAPPPAVHYRTIPERTVAGGRVVAAKGMYRDYTVLPKDHVDAIARYLQTTRKVLVQANHLKAPYNLQPGQHLKVPVAKAYEVQTGDTMTDVAKRFGVSVGELSDLNDLSVHARLHSGDLLALPDGFHDHGPTHIAATSVAERPTPVWQPPAPRRQPPVQEASGAPYVPSPDALAAAQRLAATRPSQPPGYSAERPAGNPPSPSVEAPEMSGVTQLAVASAGRGRFTWPVRGEIISPFGVKGVGRRNDGIDIRSPQGTSVQAAAAGDVVYAGDQVPGFGNLVLVKHSDGWVTAYAHLQTISVSMRQAVVQGQTLGSVGSTGGVSEPQLHFEIRYAPTPAEKARPVDPLLVLPK